MDRIRVLLQRLRDQLSVGGEHRFAGDVDAALASCNDAVAAFVMSNELWGGAGSIADQALGGRAPERLQLERLLVELGREQIAMLCQPAHRNVDISLSRVAHSKHLTRRRSDPGTLL